MWDNILVVSTDCSHYEEVIRAYHRLLDLKNGKHIDVEVLTILIQAIEQNLPDAYERPSKTFRSSALSLFGRLSAENGSEYRIWQLYSRLILAKNSGEIKEEDHYKAAQMMQKSTASFMQKEKDWHKSTQEAINGMNLAEKYAERCIEASKVTSNPAQNVQQMSSAKMTIKSMISRVKQSLSESLENENSDLAKEFQSVNQVLESLINQIAVLKK